MNKDKTTDPLIPSDTPAENRLKPVRHIELNPLMEVPPEDPGPQEVYNQKQTPIMENPAPIQDLFDTQMEVPFSEDNVEPVFKRPDIADFKIPPVLEEMIPDGALIHKHLPKQADIDRIIAQINISEKYLRKMHLPCSLMY